MIDLHSHLLPGVDDGSRTVGQSVAVLQEMARQGVTDVCLTPHLQATYAHQGVPEAQDRAFEALIAAAPPAVRLHRGMEVMLDRPLTAEIGQGRAITLAGTRYILVEFPRLVTAQTVLHALHFVTAVGLIPLVAHPERYKSCSPAAVRRWKEAGALMQVDANTALSPRGRGERARRLLAEGLADIAAADNHGDDRTLAALGQALAEQEGGLQARLLLEDNPRAILEDRPVAPVPGLTLRTSLVTRLKQIFEREDE